MKDGDDVWLAEWRDDEFLRDGTILFTEENFVERIQEFSDEKKWRRKSKAALRIADSLAWPKVLKPVVDIIEKND